MHRSLTTLTIAAAAFAATAHTPATAEAAGFPGYAAQIRAQMAVVEAQADALVGSCPHARRDADDIYDALDDLCRRMNRFEEALAAPVLSRGQLNRLERLARRVDRESAEVLASVHHAIARMRQRHALRAPVVVPQPPVAVFPTQPAPRGVTVSFGRFGLRVNTGVHASTFRHPLAGAALARHGFATHRLAGLHAGLRHGVARPTLVGAAPTAWPQEPIADALCLQANRLRLMTQQLLALVCG